MTIDLEFLLFWWSAYLPLLLSLSRSSRTYIPPATPIQPVGLWVGWLDLFAGHSFLKGRDADGISQHPRPGVCCAELLQSCLTLCDPMDWSPPGSSVHGILQARILEWIAPPSSRGPSWFRDRTRSLRSPALAGRFFTTSATWEVPALVTSVFIITWFSFNRLGVHGDV